MRRRWVRILLGIVAVIALAAIGLGAWVYHQLAGSLPQLAGDVAVQGISGDVKVERDGQGVVTVRAANRPDLSFGIGYAHGQDRFFQMDLARRAAAGELAALVGKAVLERDRKVRIHQFRQVAAQVLKSAEPTDRDAIEAYARGVNAGLASLSNKPFEYLLLGLEPAPWKPEDTVLVSLTMFLQLQGRDYQGESALGLIHDVYPKSVAEFLAPKGTEWDAAIDGGEFPPPPIPGPDVINFAKETKTAARGPIPSSDDPEPFIPGSNNWAVAGTHTKHGGALVADDMHLGISVPNTWYRASLVVQPAEGPERRITGVTLPGAPLVIVGSNGHIAWAFTNSEGDWNDLVILETDAAKPKQYKTPDGWKEFETAKETIEVSGGPAETLEIQKTIWGPVLDKDHKGRPRAWKWVACEPGGVNFGLGQMQDIQSLDEAMAKAATSGAPAQNFVCADKTGRIGWTIIGRIPRRVGFEGRLPESWADGKRRWDGWLDPKDYPRVVDPKSGRIWTANARVVSGKMLDVVGFGGYDLGARQKQIRDDLLRIEKASEADMLAVQLDDKAVFWERWQKLLLDTLGAKKDDAKWVATRKQVEEWGGKADVNSVGYRLVFVFRDKALNATMAPFIERLQKADKSFRINEIKSIESPLWRLVHDKPKHLLSPAYPSWDQLLGACVDATLQEVDMTVGGDLGKFTWGDANTTRIQHPLSLAVPALSRYLDMPRQPLPGGWAHMPRIQRPESGASERLAVSPGREESGYFHMPGGQSGHPLSPYYGDGHAAWAEGKPTPFLPGPTVNTLVLKPATKG